MNRLADSKSFGQRADRLLSSKAMAPSMQMSLSKMTGTSVALFRCAVADFAANRMSSARALYFDARLGQSTASHWRVQLSRRGGVRRVGYGSYKRFCRHYSFRHWMCAHCSGSRAILPCGASVNRQRPPYSTVKKHSLRVVTNNYKYCRIY